MPFYDQPTDKLEKQYREPYYLWKNDPSPQNATKLLQAVKPDIDRAIAAYVGTPNPLIRGRAKQLALRAAKTYDPTKARFGTHVVNQLQSLRRVNRQQTQILPMPERVAIERFQVDETRAEMADELGREPTITELADKTGLSKRRITYLRKFSPGVAESTMSLIGDEDGDEFRPEVQKESDVWMEFVYDGLSNIDRKVMDWSLGLHGEPRLSNTEIARRLRMTPGAVSQRKAKIQQQIDQEFDISPFTGM